MATKVTLTADSYEIELSLDRWEVYMTIMEMDDPENSYATAGLNKFMIDELISNLTHLRDKLDDENE